MPVRCMPGSTTASWIPNGRTSNARLSAHPSSALFEATDIDPQSARYINKNLADYLIPVNADTPSVEILMIPERDERVNALGIKGIGEIGIVGMNAAVANAVFNATGIRVRDLPIRAEKLLSAPYSLFS